MMLLSFLPPCNTSFLTRSVKLNVSPFPSVTFQHILNPQRNSCQLFEVCRFHHHIRLCSKCTISLVYALNLSPICWWKCPYVECCFFHDNSGFNRKERKPTRCNNIDDLLSIVDVDYWHCLNMFRASLCPSSGERARVTACGVYLLVVLDVAGCGTVVLCWGCDHCEGCCRNMLRQCQ